ncbi:MAG: chloroplast lycopene beta cyclase precursor [Monoraphidium minutum]|nr:MAG: chloroplast lycopene beta cyclase precursor [Monoraphidium minutum]
MMQQRVLQQRGVYGAQARLPCPKRALRQRRLPRVVRAAAIDTAPTIEEALKAGQPVKHYLRPQAPWPIDVPIQTLQFSDAAGAGAAEVDLVIAGAGPSGLAVGARVAEAGYRVAIIDPEPLGIWPNNYGVWVDEFQAMGLEDCLEVVWPKAKVWLDNNVEPNLGEKFLSRPYGRVDRPRLKRKLLERCVSAGVKFVTDKVEGVAHGGGSSTVSTAGGKTVKGSLVLDATGHSRRLVKFDQKFDPGYQGAYGIIAEVEGHPFALDTMLFMDWRDDHLAGRPELREKNAALPTFLYAMPFSENRIFLEETSLVARPAVAFEDLKQRLEARMEWLGIKVTKIEEEEYCLIPMGGALPAHPQRVLGVGGTAGMVHPATGFMVSRMLGVAPTIADSIIDQLARPADRADAAGATRGPQTEAQADAMAAAVWRAAWPVERLRQRAFFCFGMDVLLRLNLAETRQFFSAFFSLSAFHWHGFLSARLGFAQLIAFGLSLFAKSSNQARTDLLVKGLPGLVGMLAGLVPTLGQYYKPEGDVGLGAGAGTGASAPAAAPVAEPVAAGSK